jgi:hypothetical protein
MFVFSGEKTVWEYGVGSVGDRYICPETQTSHHIVILKRYPVDIGVQDLCEHSILRYIQILQSFIHLKILLYKLIFFFQLRGRILEISS